MGWKTLIRCASLAVGLVALLPPAIAWRLNPFSLRLANY